MNKNFSLITDIEKNEKLAEKSFVFILVFELICLGDGKKLVYVFP